MWENLPIHCGKIFQFNLVLDLHFVQSKKYDQIWYTEHKTVKIKKDNTARLTLTVTEGHFGVTI